MGYTDIFEGIVIARWTPGDRFTLNDIYRLANELNVGCAVSTIRRTMQELRDRNLMEIHGGGNYLRLATQEETAISSDSSNRSHFISALHLRDNRFPLNSRLQELVDKRIQRLANQFTRRPDSNLHDIPDIIVNSAHGPTETATSVMTRLGQGKFRNDLIVYWKRKCAVTSCRLLPILRASHIKPWRDSNDEERLDAFNGLLLVPHLDALFDSGWITFDDDGEMKVSKIITQEDCELFQIPSQGKIAIVDAHIPYLTFHRDNIFLGT